MTTETKKLIRTEPAVLDIGDNIGALIIYTHPTLLGYQIDITPTDHTTRTHTDVLERRFHGHTLHAALFQSLPTGHYHIWLNHTAPIGEIEIIGGQVQELHWQHLFLDTLTPARLPTTPTLSTSSLATPPMPTICPTPMASAPMRYTPDGKVAWDTMWTDFCDLALLGGPPHRGTLLEPVMPDEIAHNPTRYQEVVAEIQRGWQLVTNLPTTQSSTPGWVGLICHDEPMALWLLRAILAENVTARRELHTLYLPASPNFTLTAEIKNVITVVAKTHHYWQEHRF